MKQQMSLKQYLELGGKIEALEYALDTYNNQTGPISFSHTNPPSFGNPKGVDMYNVGTKKVADSWIQVAVWIELKQQYL